MLNICYTLYKLFKHEHTVFGEYLPSRLGIFENIFNYLYIIHLYYLTIILNILNKYNSAIINKYNSVSTIT